MPKNTSFILGDHFDSFVAAQVRSGRYANATDVIRSGLRLLEERESRLEALRREARETFLERGFPTRRDEDWKYTNVTPLSRREFAQGAPTDAAPEDLGLVVGCALHEALGDRTGIRRYGWATVPMDEALVTAAIDLSGRPFLVYDLAMPKAKVGGWDVELGEVFFEAVRGSGGTARLVLLPYEDHGYQARENLEHVLWEQLRWFDRYVKGAEGGGTSVERHRSSASLPHTA